MLGGGTLSPSDVAGRLLPVVPTGGPPPVGPDGTLNKVLEPFEHSVLDHADPHDWHVFAQEVLEPLEHSVLDHADPPDWHVFAQEVLEPLEHSVLDAAGPAGRPVAVGPVGPLRTLSPSDCHSAGPAGPYVAGGPVGPDGTLEKVRFWTMLTRLASMRLSTKFWDS